MRNVFVFLFILVCCCGFSQGFNKNYAIYHSMARNIDTVANGYMVMGNIEQPTSFVNTWLARLDNNGDTLWTKQFGDDSIQYKCYAMFRSNDGGYFMCGDYQKASTYPNMDSYLLKVDSAGHTVWFNKYGPSIAEGGGKDYAMQGGQLDNGGVLLLGWAKHLYDNSGNLLGWGLWNSCVSAFDASGNNIRNRSLVFYYESDTADTIHFGYTPVSIATVGNKGFACFRKYNNLTGQFVETIVLGLNNNLDTLFSMSLGQLPQIEGLSCSNHHTIFIYGENYLAEMDTSGTLLWQTNPPVIHVCRVKNSSAGEIIMLSGYAYGNMANEADPYVMQSSTGRVVLNTFSSSGMLLSADTVWTSPGNTYPVAADFTPTTDSSFAFAGCIYQRIWAVKLDSLQVPGGIVSYVASSKISIVPIPADDRIFVKGVNAGEAVFIFSAEGKLVREEVCSRENDFAIDVSAFSAGVYYLRSGVQTVKFIRR